MAQVQKSGGGIQAIVFPSTRGFTLVVSEINAWGPSRSLTSSGRASLGRLHRHRTLPPPLRCRCRPTGTAGPLYPRGLRSNSELRGARPQVGITVSKGLQESGGACQAMLGRPDALRSARPSSRATERAAARGSGLSESASRDPVRRYLAEITRVSLLSADQEFALARRIERGDHGRQARLNRGQPASRGGDRHKLHRPRPAVA